MEYTTLGRTGLKVSVAGLGCGGFSRLGLGTGKSETDAIAIIRAALDLGVNLFDTAAAYGTEPVLGKALAGVPRDKVVICTKAPFGISNPDSLPERAVASLDRSLKELGTDYIDVYQLHGIAPRVYDHALKVLAPALLREREKGKFRWLGITETSPGDPEHQMIKRAARDGAWDVVMVAFHMMHQNARRHVFPLTQDDPLGFLVHEGGATSVVDAAYRFVRHEPGVDVVLFGTGDHAHLRSNIASILKPPLPEADRARLASLFGHLVGVGLDAPHLSRAGRVTTS
ncbi:MAG: aldo/keto reductase [Alphaproteobacteria bacterium]|nr:MAG: aldo/keto reductase [Alphaproteobacteria bacterium]